MESQRKYIYIDNLIELFPSIKLLFNDIYEKDILFKSVEEEFCIISTKLFHFFSKKEISYEDKFILFKELAINSTITYHQSLSDIQQRIINYLNSLNYPVCDIEVQKRKTDRKALDEYLRKVFTTYITVLTNMRKTNTVSIDDLLGMTDCNGKKEREYWVEYIIRELNNTQEKGLVEILTYLNYNTKDPDVEIDLSQVSLKQLREIHQIIKIYSK
ncbi:hypothetical protein EHI8A_030310 [Entamoeba histolytica HM-1:IMSS-B]|uniref:Uncharacterized protein n=6 Tax=Entamoeba histolytica TaxID=5759 RepID=C4LVR1_ENTH1|nr:hypothetical protein EHI_186940 [Entamoeba histolytica HM-1:IMSS]EMD49366.1 Hypothetical protein EHI5A_056970 [Entamoeba histolytica KU27]EMH77509.1 hypothetical protein EHI8A_030310 [Entamoeba histolytica HM-1:IMSS-B]EMS12029.1 hypothetical protein KM1_070420 [Entamoeba histolytica HM-3:IMSS]ENY64264.1 hypothetical protein EHI7A_033210 [Entamoeba histolytica HM-1:IMSS-A]GAT92766.1 hypothetical protein CL6EHI_186940 [Entamoeba histolytica]|eukprot:XP_656427.1 hypothetical protein EHI_186940 [Entamoeba histolytica HM-1:IMSS]